MRWRAGASQVIATAVVVIAIVGGQWTLWWHIQRDHALSHLGAEDSAAEGGLFAGDSVTLELGEFAGGLSVLPEQFEPDLDAAAAGSGARISRDDVQYFPEAAQSRPSKDAVAQTGVAILRADGRLQTVAGPDCAEQIGTADEAPGTLQLPADAAPIEPEDSALRALIQMELPNATPDELEIWADEMQGLPPESVREILRLRKRLGGRRLIPSWITEPPGLARLEETPGRPANEPEGVAILDGSTNARIEPTLSALRLARDVIVNNIANAHTTAFKRSVLDFEDLSYEKLALSDPASGSDQSPVAVGLGIRLAGTPIDHAQGTVIATGRPLNLAIDGRGFLQVTDGQVSYFTRAGTLTVDAGSQLAFASADRVLPLVPTITIPEGAFDIEVAGDGTVSVRMSGQEDRETIGRVELCRFVNPPALERVGGNLFLPTIASGPPVPGKPESEGRGALRQGRLEQSNVDPSKEEALLRLLDQHMETVRRAAQTPNPPPVGPPLREAAHR